MSGELKSSTLIILFFNVGFFILMYIIGYISEVIEPKNMLIILIFASFVLESLITILVYSYLLKNRRAILQIIPIGWLSCIFTILLFVYYINTSDGVNHSVSEYFITCSLFAVCFLMPELLISLCILLYIKHKRRNKTLL